MTRLAPIALHTAIVLQSVQAYSETHKRPTGPAPKTATLSTAETLAILQTALTATESGSICPSASVSDQELTRAPSSRDRFFTSANGGTHTYIRQFVAQISWELVVSLQSAIFRLSSCKLHIWALGISLFSIDRCRTIK